MWAATAGLAMLVLDLPIVGTIRPQLFGQLGVALFLLAIAELPRSGRALFWLPLVAALIAPPLWRSRTDHTSPPPPFPRRVTGR